MVISGNTKLSCPKTRINKKKSCVAIEIKVQSSLAPPSPIPTLTLLPPTTPTPTSPTTCHDPSERAQAPEAFIATSNFLDLCFQIGPPGTSG